MLNGFFLEIFLAIKVTLSVALGASIVGILGGLFSLFIEKVPGFGVLIKLWNMFIRGIPELLVLFAIYFGLTQILTDLTGEYVEVDALSAGILALGIIFAAYAVQIFQAAFNAVDQGEVQAAEALGLRKIDSFRFIILPQVWRHALPGLFNLWLVVLKDSSIVSLIGLHDMMNQAQIAANQSFEPFTYYSFVGALYLGLTAISQWVSSKVNHKLSRGAYV
ncbi:ABC transporter permease subunit [Thiotrichales bacterium 19S11-10]|nr:ABC transporter permease subunit [Thiotrichales bacterium 19S11-10]MCF6808127.1 ABC transporter permease subunit [Thiotrichales bacterium 19S9-11]MCF6812143.1 ABC transporter permease subunit [Thiotrichales bacterium 19S9-12]